VIFPGKKLSCSIRHSASELYIENPEDAVSNANCNLSGRARAFPRQLARQVLDVNKDAQKDVVSETIILDLHAISGEGRGARRAWYDSATSSAISRATVKDLDRRYFA